MKNQTTQAERLYAIVKHYEQDLIDISERASFIAQDMARLKEELAQLVDEERYHRGFNNA